MLSTLRTKSWRRVKSLDVYSDRQAEAIYAESFRRHAGGLTVMFFFGLFVAFVVACVTIFLAGMVSRLVYTTIGIEQSGLEWVFVAMPIAMGPIAGAMAFSGFRQECIDECIERELKFKRADVSRCKSCGYSLEGLPEIDCVLRCPECAHETSTVWYTILHDLGIEQTDASPSVERSVAEHAGSGPGEGL